MTYDPTEVDRRAMLPTMPAELAARLAAGEDVWNTAEMQERYTVLGFMAPFVAVARKADGAKGSLMFNHSPRYYFGWKADA